MDLLFLIIGILIGSVFTYFLTRALLAKDKASIEVELGLKSGSINQLADLNQQQKQEIEIKEIRVNELTAALSKKETDLIHLNQKLKDQKDDILKLQQHFREEFKNLANEILEEKTQKFTNQNKEKLNEILQPLSDKIKDFEKKVEETYDKESKLRFSLIEEIKRLEDLNQQVSKDTLNLTKALKGESKTQGNWGEVVLENILEKSGLIKNQEYYVQSSYTNAEGKRLQPDIVVSYPGNRHVVIDSKVSLTAYERYITAESEDEAEVQYKAHIISIKNHINELSSKNYQDLYELNSLDFVMMFLPIEPAYLIAIQKDPELWNFAYDKRVLLISPTNLIAALKMVESLWQQEYQGRNVQEIARQSGDLYDKFDGFVKDLIEMGKKIKDADKFYEKSMNKLSTGKGNLVRRVEKIKKLGAKTTKELPQKLIDKSIEEDEE